MANKNPIQVPLQPIGDIAAKLGLGADDLILYGDTKAKVRLEVLRRSPQRQGKLILVSAMTPTPAGEGKTTITIGLGQALARLGLKTCIALREPSLGPCFGMKGGATGGGKSSIHPAEEINLHFTGDFHAITSAHNLLSALLDNRIYHHGLSDIDPQRITWRRVMDMNDRALRKIVIGLGGSAHGVPHEGGFDITAASEIMAILCLAENHDDLKARLGRILVAFTYDDKPVTAASLNAAGAMTALLKDALLPNLVQTSESVPAFVHGGPFANIAHGCNSVLATRMALALSDWAVTEAGFGFDLGAEKFFDIKCAGAGLDTAAVVLVVTCRALKLHGGVKLADLAGENVAALERGLSNLDKHVENIGRFGEPPIVCVNRFAGDPEPEVRRVLDHCRDKLKVACAVANVCEEGGEGGLDLARAVIARAEKTPRPFTPLYRWEEDIKTKIRKVASSMYGASAIEYTPNAERDINSIIKLGYDKLPVCIAKTQSSLTDDPKRLGRPEGFTVTVREVLVAAGAGFLIPITGDIMRMPGLPAHPRAEQIDVIGGDIVGLT